MNYLISTNQVLQAYIKAGVLPLVGGRAYVVDNEGRDFRDSGMDNSTPIAACPIGALCLESGIKATHIQPDSFCDIIGSKPNGDGNHCWVDGFIAGWEETDTNAGFSPQDFGYTAGENPDGLEVYIRGYHNGQHIRRDFIRLRLRAA